MNLAPAATPLPERLSIEHLHVTYLKGDVQAVKGVSLSLEAGEIVGLVGESGSGKSSVALAVLRLLPRTAQLSGRILLGPHDLASLGERQMRQIRGRRVGMIFQDPSAALNPVFPISTQIVDTLKRHRIGISTQDAMRIAAETIESMGIPASRLKSYPHQLSGGMKQRALIAATMVAEPDFLVADEPTSDLDTISQAQILGLLRTLRLERGVGILLISHDLGVIASVCDRVAVMYRGYLVEVGRTEQVMAHPLHPYTKGLLHVSRKDREPDGRFITISRRQDGGVSTGCPYYEYCPARLAECATVMPGQTTAAGHVVRCHLYPQDAVP